MVEITLLFYHCLILFSNVGATIKVFLFHFRIKLIFKDSFSHLCQSNIYRNKTSSLLKDIGPKNLFSLTRTRQKNTVRIIHCESNSYPYNPVLILSLSVSHPLDTKNITNTDVGIVKIN